MFELFQKIGDAQPDKCEVCEEGPLERVLYPVAVHFKGSGFYSTDYGRGGKRKRDESKDGAKAETKESKPEKKTEKKEKAAET